jgi:hypothetical protein
MHAPRLGPGRSPAPPPPSKAHLGIVAKFEDSCLFKYSNVSECDGMRWGGPYFSHFGVAARREGDDDRRAVGSEAARPAEQTSGDGRTTAAYRQAFDLVLRDLRSAPG